MPRPTDSPLFATDATFTVDGDAWGGDPTRDDPGAGRMAEGFEPDILPAEWLNHVLGVHGDWLDWVDSSIDADGLVLDAIRTVTKFAAAYDFVPSAGTSGGLDSGPQCLYTISTNTGLVSMDLTRMLHKGGEFKQVRVLVDPGAARAGANRVNVKVYRRTVSGSTITDTQLGSTTYDDTTSNPQWITVSFTPVVVGDSAVYVQVIAGNDAGVNNDKIHLVETTQDCLSVRND